AAVSHAYELGNLQILSGHPRVVFISLSEEAIRFWKALPLRGFLGLVSGHDLVQILSAIPSILISTNGGSHEMDQRFSNLLASSSEPHFALPSESWKDLD